MGGCGAVVTQHIWANLLTRPPDLFAVLGFLMLKLEAAGYSEVQCFTFGSCRSLRSGCINDLDDFRFAAQYLYRRFL